MNRVLVVYREADEVGPYKDAVAAAGLEPVLARADEKVSLDEVDGLLLTGGNDVDPGMYGETRHPETEEPDPERDALEQKLLREAIDRDLPALAICRGLQLMNVVHGGDLVQHLEPLDRHRVSGGDKSLPAHPVAVEPGTLLEGIADAKDWQVNSRHHQAVKTVGEGLRVAAYDPADGTIEALERPDKRFVLGVQWHPENQIFSDPAQLRLFERFGDAVRFSPAGATGVREQE